MSSDEAFPLHQRLMSFVVLFDVKRGNNHIEMHIFQFEKYIFTHFKEYVMLFFLEPVIFFNALYCPYIRSESVTNSFVSII